MPPTERDPTAPIRAMASEFPDVLTGTSCTQSAFKTKKGAFLYIGPGAKGLGFKAMFKLEASRSRAEALAASDPKRFELGTGSWVVARFTAEKPMPKSLWSRWLKESHALVADAKQPSSSSTSTKRPRARKA